MTTIRPTLEDVRKGFNKLSLQKRDRQKERRAPFTVDSKYVSTRWKHDKENYPRCKAALAFDTPPKGTPDGGVSPFFVISPVNDEDDLIVDDSLKLKDLDNDEDSFVSRAKSPDSTTSESDGDESASNGNGWDRTPEQKRPHTGVNLTLTPTAHTAVQNDNGVFSTAKKTVDANYQSRILCELYGRACLTTPGLFKRAAHKQNLDKNIAKVLDFDSCNEDEPVPRTLKTPVKLPTKCPPAQTEQKHKANVGRTKTKYAAEEIRNVAKYDFVQSLSDGLPMWRCDEAALMYRNKFKQSRTKLTEKLFVIFSETVFEERLLMTEIPVAWSAKLQKTAGTTHNKRHRDGKRSSSISLSEKVITNSAMLRDTLIHEMCHCATWIIDGEWKAGHGPVWKKWGAKVTRRYPLLSINRCHNYKIQYKYTYKCTGCCYEIGRQSKSIDMDKRRCGICHGRFELLLNRCLESGTVVTTPASQRKVSGFALYVREYYATAKQDGRSHADVMKILARQFALLKAAGLT